MPATAKKLNHPKNELTTFVSEAFQSAGSPSDKIDRAAGIVRDVVLFAPQRKGDVYESKNGNIYAASFFESAKTVLEGAPCYDGHPEPLPNGMGMRNRKVSESVGRIRNVRMVGEKLLGDLHFIKDVAEGFLNRIEAMWDTFGMSVAARAKYAIDSIGREVMTGFDALSKRRPTIDLVDQPGAATNIFESVQDEPSKENTMTPEEIQALIDAAVEKKGKDISESFKDRIAAGDKAIASIDAMRRSTLVMEKLTAAKLVGDNSKYVTESLKATLATCPEADMDKFLTEHKTMLGNLINPVNGMGHEQNGGGQGGARTKTITETVGIDIVREGTKHICETLAEGKTGAERAQRVAARWIAEVAPVYQLEFAKRDDAKIAKANQFLKDVSIRDIFESVFGVRADWGLSKYFHESAIVSTSYSIITGSLLGTKVIEGYNTTAGLIGDNLVTPYQSRLLNETFPGFDAPAGITDVAEAAKYPDVTIAENGVGDTTFAKRGAMVLISEEVILFDQTGQLLMRANGIGRVLAIDREKMILKSIMDQTSFKPYWPLSGGTATQTDLYGSSQLITGTPFRDYLSVDSLKTKLALQVDSNGDPIFENAMAPYEVLVPLALDSTANRVLNSTEINYSNTGGEVGARAPNPHQGTKVWMSPLLDQVSQTTWYGAGAGGFKRQFIEKIHFPFQVVQVPPSEADHITKDLVGGIRARYKSKVFALDNKFVVRVTA